MIKFRNQYNLINIVITPTTTKTHLSISISCDYCKIIFLASAVITVK